MKHIWNNLSSIIIIVLIGIIFLQRACAPDGITEEELKKKYIRIGSEEYELLKHKRDTVWKTETFYVKGDPIPGKIIYKEIPADVDTAQILRDYFALHPYKDEVKIQKEGDSTDYGDLTVTEVITQNKSIGRKYNFNIKIPTYTESIVVKEKPRNKVYIGGGINFDQVNFLNSAYVGGLFQTKQDHIYGLNLGLSTTGTEVTPFVGGSIYWKIRFKKQTINYDKLDAAAAQAVINNLSN